MHYIKSFEKGKKVMPLIFKALIKMTDRTNDKGQVEING